MTTWLETDQIGGDTTSAIPTKKLYTTVEDFVAHVIYDGRFIDRFTTDPREVAHQIGVELTPEVITALDGQDRGEVLAETTRKMTHQYGETKKLVAPAVDAVPFIVVGVIAIVVVFVTPSPARRTVLDLSPDADQKL